MAPSGAEAHSDEMVSLHGAGRVGAVAASALAAVFGIHISLIL